jgi:formiminotetrahydrofolate cyclodeaminase
MATSTMSIDAFTSSLAAKQPTPGGGAAAAVGAAVGAAAAAMSAQYTQRKKDVESGAAAVAKELIESLDVAALLASADADASAYAELQRTWKTPYMPPGEKADIEARALAVPVSLVGECHRAVMAIKTFLPSCNPNIVSQREDRRSHLVHPCAAHPATSF